MNQTPPAPDAKSVAAMAPEALLPTQHSTANGLTASEAAQRLAQGGPNPPRPDSKQTIADARAHGLAVNQAKQAVYRHLDRSAPRHQDVLRLLKQRVFKLHHSAGA